MSIESTPVSNLMTRNVITQTISEDIIRDIVATTLDDTELDSIVSRRIRAPCKLTNCRC
jgi:hypothetical protein